MNVNIVRTRSVTLSKISTLEKDQFEFMTLVAFLLFDPKPLLDPFVFVDEMANA